jgi:nucleotidyltransferase/DNA polymerase involved in DNA repair
MPRTESIVYIALPGLLARVAARERALDGDRQPVAVLEGRQVRDLSPAALRAGLLVGQSALQARRRCPALLALPLETIDPRGASEQFYETVAAWTPTVEPHGPDALWAQLPDDAIAPLCAGLADRTPRIGIGASRLVAWATAQSQTRFEDCPAACLWADDPAMTAALLRLGLTTVGAVVAVGEDALRYRFGPRLGTRLWRRACGRDDTPVQALWPPPSVIVTDRFDLEPLVDSAGLDARMDALAQRGASLLQEQGRYGRQLELTIDTERESIRRLWCPPWPLQPADTLARAAQRLRASMPPSAPVIGLRLTISGLTVPSARTLTLWEGTAHEDAARLDAAGELVRARYGVRALVRASRLPLDLRDRRRRAEP